MCSGISGTASRFASAFRAPIYGAGGGGGCAGTIRSHSNVNHNKRMRLICFNVEKEDYFRQSIKISIAT